MCKTRVLAAQTLYRYVLCEPVDGVLRITEIKMRNNNVRGWFQASAVKGLTALKLLDVSGKGNLFSNLGCVALPACWTPELACITSKSGLSFCSSTDAPTASPSAGSHNDLANFQAFYDATGGDNWFACGGQLTREFPCLDGGCVSLVGGVPRYISCDGTDINSRILEINLPSNRMDGTIPQDAVQGMDALVLLNLRNTATGNEKCVLQRAVPRPAAVLHAGNGLPARASRGVVCGRIPQIDSCNTFFLLFFLPSRSSALLLSF